MPSKRGSRGGGGAVPLAEALASAMTAAPTAPPAAAVAVDPGNANQPLQRGAEVDRFNDLVSRLESLTPEESDELYRFRMRRLLTTGRVLDRAAYLSEQELRETLDRYRRRLDALRALEGLRAEQGLAGEFDVEPSIQERAQSRLLEMAQARPRGLIAGTSEDTPAASGTVRVPGVGFAPAAT